MQKVIFMKDIQEYASYLDQGVIDYINENQIETFESFKDYDIIAFDWYNIKNINEDASKIIVYIDRDDLFYICENERSYNAAISFFENSDSNEISMYNFFDNLLKGSTKYLEDFEDKVSKIDESIMKGIKKNNREKIIKLRYEVLRLKKYYEQFDFAFEELKLNDNDLLSDDCLKYFNILKNRSKRFVSMVSNLKEYVTQVRESYQAQIDIEQNKLMKLFTVVTSIFLPLTLITGWYGMNLKMPEYDWELGYLFVIAIFIIVSIIWYIIFKKKKFF